jgi:hypothetical protein
MIDPITKHILSRDRKKRIIKLKKQLSVLQEKKKKCKTAWDPIQCTSHYNQKIADIKEKIKKI